MTAQRQIGPRPARRRLDRRSRDTGGALRIAMLAPPWISIPPPGYGGIENVVSLLTDELVRRGHRVTLFAAPGSRSAAPVRPMLAEQHADRIGLAVYEVDHVARALAAIDPPGQARGGFDVVHDHCGHAALAMADRLTTPMVHTIHGPLTGDEFGFYGEHGDKALLVALSQAQLSRAPARLRDSAVVPNPTVVERWPLVRDKDDYLLWAGRMCPDKGPHRAIDAAKMAGRKLILAGPIQPGQDRFYATEVEPRLDNRAAEFIGEVGGRAKAELFARASALLMPIRWPEPFGMVMIEALACGTPVIAFPAGSAPEIVLDGENGFLVDDEAAMARAAGRLGEIDPARCRAGAELRFDVEVVARGYERVYEAALLGRLSPGREAHPDAVRATSKRDHAAATA